MRVLLALVVLGGCVAIPAGIQVLPGVIMTTQQLRAMCEADPETAVAIAERFDHLTPYDGPEFVRRACDGE